MQNIYFGKTLIAIRIKKIARGSVPQSEASAPLQVLTLKHPQGRHVQPHLHIPKKRTTDRLQECLIVLRGKVRIDLYTTEKQYVKYVYLKTGETLLLVNGGYGVRWLEDSELIEFKNGPFVEDKVFI